MNIILKKKTLASLIAMLLMLTIVLSMACTQPANAAYARFYKDMVYLSIAPNTIGLGQTSLFCFFCDKLPPTALGEYGDRFTFDVNIIRPDGTNDTIKGVQSDPVGAAYSNYVPTETGTYIVQAIMRQCIIDGGSSRGLVAPQGAGWWPSGQPPNANSVPKGWSPIGVVFESALSETQTLTVTTDQMVRYPETPLPTDYWSRPVYDTNRGWGPVVLGQYLAANELSTFGSSRYNPYTVGPASSHVLWTRPFFNGGIAGGYSTVNSSSSDNSYYSGQSYESYGGPSIILNGKFYYAVGSNPKEGWYCCDLYSGETIYFRNNSISAASGGSTSAQGSIPSGAPAFGQVLVEDNPNQHGTISYYWVTSPIGKTNTWEMYDDFSGNYICSIANVTWTDTNNGKSVSKGASGTSAVGTDGSILRYNFVNLAPANAAPQWYLQVWNTSQTIMYSSYVAHEDGSGTNANWMWRPNLNYTYDGRNGLSANVSVPTLALSTINVRQVVPDDKLVIIYAGSNNGSVSVPGSVVQINLKPGFVGQVINNYNFTCPPTVGDLYGQAEQFSNKNTAFSSVCIQEGIFWYYDAMTRTYFIYNLADGSLAWKAPPAEQFQFYGGATAVCYKGEFIDCGGYAGVVRAFDAKTGTSLWNWTAPPVGVDETPYQYTPTSFGFLTGDGQLYLYSSEHSNNNPIRRDAQIWDVNVSNGKLIWMLTDWPSSAPIVADGRLLVVDSHDEMIYCFGQGPSATTVSAPQIVPPLGSTVELTGTVTDQSQYGRRNINGDIDRVLKGTPAINDASMDAWMEYMFHQRPMPTNATGVSVSLDTIDPNGNLIHIGDTTSDAASNYGIAYKPDVPGTYQIIATFKGSNSYGSSFGTTYLTIGSESTTPAPTTTTQAQSVADTYLIPVGVAIIVAIAIAAVVIVLALKRKP
jgi:hypothetical protein